MNNSFLKAKEIPFFLTLLFGILGYMLKTISDQIVNSDIIEYKFSDADYQNQNAIRFIISNLSTQKSYENLNFSILRGSQDKIKFKEGYVVPNEPFSENFARISKENRRSFFSDNVNFKIKNLLPGAIYHLIITYENGILLYRPILNIDIEHPNSDQLTVKNHSPYIQEANWKTFLAKNDLTILVILVFIWSILISFYIIFSNHSIKQ